MSTESVTSNIGNHLLDNVPLAVAGVVFFTSLHFVFARLLLPHFPSGILSGFFVLGIGTLEWGSFLAVRGKIRLDLFRQNIWFFLAIGFLVACSTSLNYTAVAFIDPGTASLLSQSSPIFALALSVFWLRERLSAMQWIGAFLALCGVFVISFQGGDYLRVGSLLVLVAAFVYATHAAIVKRYGNDLELMNFFLFRIASTTAFLFLFVIASGQWHWPTQQGWLVLLLVGTVDVVVSRMFYYITLRRLQMSFQTILLTLSPVLTIMWSWLLFDQWPTLQALIGGSVVIAGVMLVTASKNRAGREKKAVSSKQ